MQAFVSLPKIDEKDGPKGWGDLLFRKICGIPLLVRVLAAAAKSGVKSVVIVYPRSLPEDWLASRLDNRLLSSMPVKLVAMDQAFQPAERVDWQFVEDYLAPTFLWLPWNTVILREELIEIISSDHSSEGRLQVSNCSIPAAGLWSEPMVMTKSGLPPTVPGGSGPSRGDSMPQPLEHTPTGGIAVNTAKSALAAERLVMRGSGKALDGLYSNTNRWICRPAVRWLSKTPITANMVTMAGLPIVALSGYSYAQGDSGGYALGGVLFYLSVLFDEADGMVARTKFQESVFGCWLESFVDYFSYILLFTGMILGLYRQYGTVWLMMGGLLCSGLLLSFLVAIRLRKISTRPDRPEEHVKRYYARLESDSGNLFSRVIRKLHFLTKKGPMCYYVLLFSLLGGVPIFVVLATVGSHLTWMLGLYSQRLFPGSVSPAELHQSIGRAGRSEEPVGSPTP